MLDVVVFKINKYNGGQAWGNHKATGERTQHHSLFPLSLKQ